MLHVLRRVFVIGLSTLLLLILLGAAALGLAIMVAYPRLPSLTVLTDYQPKIPLRVYTSDGLLIGEFGEERRAFITIDKVPQLMKQALIAAEDERFYQHGGVDYIGVARAMLGNLGGSAPRSGASTITMQVAKNFFLSPEQTLTRKFNEALLAFKIERNLSKDLILELYINQIYLGQRAYGFAAAAQVYFGKPLDQLSLAEMAILAALPKAPTKINPITNPKRAKQRQEYVLRKMHELNFITDQQYQEALAAPIKPVKGNLSADVMTNAEYVAEMARQAMVDRYQDKAYTQGFKVYTTIDSQLQLEATNSLRTGLLDYDARHGYRGAEAYADISGVEDSDLERLDDEIGKFIDSGDLRAALVLDASSRKVTAYLQGGESVEITGSGLQIAQRHLGSRANPNNQIRRGAIIRVQETEKGWRIRQLPAAEAALVAVNPDTGAVVALAGGFDFNRNRFNHVTQAWRQPGSSFKPFIYSAALERGFSPTTMINDAPLVIDAAQAGGQRWEPKNYDGSFSGMMSMRSALTYSKNLVSVRILQAISPVFAQQHISRFGFKPEKHPAYLTMALGAGMVTPMEMAAGYSTFANGGYRVMPYFIDHIEDKNGAVLAKTNPAKAGAGAVQTIDPRNAFIMTQMMKEVIDRGTATLAKKLGRKDLAGKTGTTNDQHDAWFAGFQRHMVTIAWLGFDQPRSLGAGETGGHTALPLWVNFMAKALKNQPEVELPLPEHVIARNNGSRTDFYYEEFAEDFVPDGLNNGSSGGPSATDQTMDNVEVKDELF